MDENPISRHDWEDLKDLFDDEDEELSDEEIDAVQFASYEDYKESWFESYCDSKASVDFEKRAYGYDYEW